MSFFLRVPNKSQRLGSGGSITSMTVTLTLVSSTSIKSECWLIHNGGQHLVIGNQYNDDFCNYYNFSFSFDFSVLGWGWFCRTATNVRPNSVSINYWWFLFSKVPTCSNLLICVPTVPLIECHFPDYYPIGRTFLPQKVWW